jgi:hypothetical protein
MTEFKVWHEIYPFSKKELEGYTKEVIFNDPNRLHLTYGSEAVQGIWYMKVNSINVYELTNIGFKQITSPIHPEKMFNRKGASKYGLNGSALFEMYFILIKAVKSCANKNFGSISQFSADGPNITLKREGNDILFQTHLYGLEYNPKKSESPVCRRIANIISDERVPFDKVVNGTIEACNQFYEDIISINPLLEKQIEIIELKTEIENLNQIKKDLP